MVTPFPASARTSTWLLLIGVIGLAMLMPSGESLWIDEAATARYAAEPNLTGLIARLAADTGSETQMPLGMLAFWAWEKVAGHSEWALRAINIGWTLLAAVALFLTGRRLRLPGLPLVFVIQPFLWFYANEARPYVMQIAGAAWLLHGLVAAFQDRGQGAGWAASLAAGAVLTAGASMLGFLPVGVAVLLTAGALAVTRSTPDRKSRLILLAGGLLLAILGVYDLQTLLRGAGGARYWSVGAMNAGFAGYELAGFLGLGPGRLEIREAARGGAPVLLALFKPYGIGLGALAAAYLLLLLPVRRVATPPRPAGLGGIALFAALTALLLLAVSLALSFPFWGRHLAPLLPAWAILLAWSADRCSKAARFPGARFVPLLLAALLLASSLSLRIAGRHRKDDYRLAVAVANEGAREGLRIGWAAHVQTGLYYGARFQTGGGTSGVFRIRTEQTDAFAGDMTPPPDRVLFSKPDLHDPEGRLSAWLGAHHYIPLFHLAGFVCWGKPSP